ncbi:MAG: leucine--tRNA ligase [Nitrococcus mobilis]|nr:leucine--tRNA ligase [Nitrococcus mobilis]
MEAIYKPEEIEAEAQRFWEANDTFRATEDPARQSYYCLSMFPYPSGKLHMGHVRNYTIGDVIARYQRMLGRNVLQPMGWDAFGLPAENAAIQNRVPPAQWTRQNIAYMRRQLKRLGFGYDWHREIATCDPGYYRWEQWLFTRLFRKGLVYKKTATVNWDPVDQTVLANEQVIDGKGWRSGAVVERRAIPQWFLKITAYADELLAALDDLPGWPEQVKTMQRNWIGRSEGIEIEFALPDRDAPLKVFTTRPDTLFGVTYLALAAEHPLAAEAARGNRELATFIERCKASSVSEAVLATTEKVGLDTGLRALHPLTREHVPIWVANFVLMEYGSGAVMAVPAHDQRDWDFAMAYALPIREVVAPGEGGASDLAQAAYTEPGVLVNSGEFSGLTSQEAGLAIAERLESMGCGKRRITYRLRDWGISRQRYWGAPIPMLHCPSCGDVPVPDQDLPVVLPEEVEFDGAGSPLQRLPAFIEARCPECGGAARRETDTFDTFMESSWYYARFACADNTQAMLDSRAAYWTPVTQYIGGIEHAILHLLYARFYHKLLRDEGLLDSDEPFIHLLTQGMVLNSIFFRRTPAGGIVYYNPAEIELRYDERGQPAGAVLRGDGQPVESAGMGTMSKSKNNGVDPQALVERFGADTVRLFILFAAPPEQALEWSDSAVEGAYRFLKRLWNLVSAHVTDGPARLPESARLTPSQQAMRRKIHETIQKASDDVGRRFTFNTAIAAVMELANALGRFDDSSDQGRAVRQEGLEAIVLILAPMVPHIAHRLWQELGHGGAVVDAAWPTMDEAALQRDVVDLVVQVNGKRRSCIQVAIDAEQEAIRAAALNDPNVRRFTVGKHIERIIVVPDRLVNVVAR